ncbi:hypothetical protein EDD37DRAFT_606686 [Exophiala viscosa]|uniref:Uncharacterized protein n=1 Tax=Exophiala viscosa TaxID=2486360 RepID=A0AAN6E7R2_9EURO|nr:hypothetical protein EDD36DRAFT_460406 [Exophiala viscosa]KAI1627902.1 hypothetical protein EDD37DRAFT_606686 [Exophiala viscosa]
MESRFRKFLSSRRLKAQQNNQDSELDLHSVPYTTAPPQGRLPVFISQALGKSSTAKRKNDPPADLRSLSYQSALPGKAPELGNRPQRGNGPVKLQTGRLLSSGELLVTQQDYDRTLEDIREGEFIVAGKEKRNSRTSSQRMSSMRPPNLKVVSTAPNSPRSQPTMSPMWPPPSAASDTILPGYFNRSMSSASGTFVHHTQPSSDYGYPPYGSSTEATGLGISTPTQPFFPSHMTSMTSLPEPQDESNPTIQAIWKAESSRLASMYGDGSIGHTMSRPNHGCASPTMSPTHRHADSWIKPDPIYAPSSVSLHQPSYTAHDPVRPASALRTYMSASNLELSYRDDHSEGSSNQRHSLLSSSGASTSLTTGTSTVEDPVTTRDDIRRIVDDMRMTYLQAIEASTPPTAPLPELPIRAKTNQPRSLVSSVSVESGLRSMRSQGYTRPWQPATTGTSTARTATSPSSRKSHKKRISAGHNRRTSQPVAGITPLSPIKASPARPKPQGTGQDDTVSLKRADSTTLGSLAKELKIHDDRSSDSHSYPTPSSPPSFDSASSEDMSLPCVTSPTLSVRTPPSKVYSVQQTPVNQKAVGYMESPVRIPTWSRDADRLFNDADIDVTGDIDDFESMCDDFFSTPAPSNPAFGTFHTWHKEQRTDGDIIKDRVANGSPSKFKKGFF